MAEACRFRRRRTGIAFPVRHKAQLPQPRRSHSQKTCSTLWPDGARTSLTSRLDKRVDEALANSLTSNIAAPSPTRRRTRSGARRRTVSGSSPISTAGTFYAYPVELFSVEAGRAIKIPYVAHSFRIQSARKQPAYPRAIRFRRFSRSGADRQAWHFQGFPSFLGATNFRAIATGQVFGVSARALAINTGQPGGEDFPAFPKLLDRAAQAHRPELVVHAFSTA